MEDYKRELKYYKKKKVLIIGSHGFIGSNLATTLCELQSYVSTLSHLADQKLIEKTIKKTFDVIFHCSGYSGELNCERHPLACLHDNYHFTHHILEAIKNVSPKTKLVLIGSRLEYGKPRYLPVNEDHPTNPLGVYGLSKLCIHKVALQYFETHQIPIAILRVSNAYGPHPYIKTNNYNIINTFIDRAYAKKQIVIFGNGEQIRDYVYITDLINALLLVGKNNKANGKIYNVGSGTSTRLKDVVKMIVQLLPTRINYIKWPHKYMIYETGDYITDITKIQRDLKWKPFITIQEGIKAACMVKK